MPTSSSPQVSAADRQIGLVVALRLRPAGMTRSQILREVHGYDWPPTPATARRFERDKDELRRLGVPLATTERDGEPVYRVDEDAYGMGEVTLTAYQARVVALAASAWGGGDLPAQALSALTKLLAVLPAPGQASGAQRTPRDEGTHEGLADLRQELDATLNRMTVDLRGQDVPAALALAVQEGRVVSFDYASLASGTVRARRVLPERLEVRDGAWYLVGRDLAEDDQRTFRLTRLRGQVTVLDGPPGAGDAASGDDGATGSRTRDDQRYALLALLPGRGSELRAQACGTVRSLPGGRELVRVPYDPTRRLALAGQIASLAGAVVVLEPAELAQAVTEHLAGVVAHTAPATAGRASQAGGQYRREEG